MLRVESECRKITEPNDLERSKLKKEVESLRSEIKHVETILSTILIDASVLLLKSSAAGKKESDTKVVTNVIGGSDATLEGSKIVAVSTTVGGQKFSVKFSMTSKATDAKKTGTLFFGPYLMVPCRCKLLYLNIVFSTGSDAPINTNFNFTLQNEDKTTGAVKFVKNFNVVNNGTKEYTIEEKFFLDNLIEAGTKTKLSCDCKIVGRAVITLMYV